MLLRQSAPGAAESLELPRLVSAASNLALAAFPLMKVLPARFMLDRATESGELEPGGTVIETSSGTFALGLALVCAARDYDLLIVSDSGLEASLRRRLEALGTRLSIVSGAELRTLGVQQARLARLERLRARYPRHYVPGQYDNPMNAAAYGSVAELLVESLGQIDCLVGTVGSGGSTRGLATFLRSVFPSLALVGVDTPGSVLFGAPAARRLLRGLGSGVHPGNVVHTLFDEVHWVGAATAFMMARELHRRHGLFMGATSGAAYLVAAWWAARHPEASVVAILPDDGHRYRLTVHHPPWLRRMGVLLEQEPAQPATIEHPSEVAGEWTRLDWRRRRLEQASGVGARNP